MPYHIGEKGSHDCAGFPVVNSDTGKVMGCHKTQEDAKKQLAALYIHVEDADKTSVSINASNKEKSMALTVHFLMLQIV